MVVCSSLLLSNKSNRARQRARSKSLDCISQLHEWPYTQSRPVFFLVWKLTCVEDLVNAVDEGWKVTAVHDVLNFIHMLVAFALECVLELENVFCKIKDHLTGLVSQPLCDSQRLVCVVQELSHCSTTRETA